MNKEEIIKACGAEIIRDSVSGNFKISTDTRTIKQNEIYLPLKGENFDGENFINDAIKNGAIGYFTTRDIVKDEAKLVLKVRDTLKAYLQLAQYYRNNINPKVIAITGSSGKTTTKEMMYAIAKQKFNTIKTISNHNNEIGFCQTVFSIDKSTEVLIIEMGMRGLGEIELITKHAQPDIAIVTNSGSAHIGRLKSLDNIAKAKCEIALGLKDSGTFIALDQDIIKNNLDFAGEKIYYSLRDVEILDKQPSYTKFLYKGKEYEMQIEGDYNISNSLSAIEAGYKLGMTYDEIRKGLYSYKPIEKRWEAEEIRGLKVINDSYNANPESMKASVSTFVELYPNPVVILGDMGELGNDEKEFHREVGRYFSKMKNVKFLTVGNLSKEIANELENKGVWVKHFSNNKEVSCYIIDNLDIGNTIFLKASRAMKFEEIIDNLKRGNIW